MTKRLGIKPYQDLEPTQAKNAKDQIIHGGEEFKRIYNDFWKELCTKPELTQEEKKQEEKYMTYVNQNIDRKVKPIFNIELQYYEINQIINNHAKNKSSGPPGHSYEFIRLIWQIAPHNILKALNYLFNNSTFPKDWCKGTISLLHKKGDKTDPANYRPITLINSFWKIIMKALDKRIKAYLEKYKLLSINQNGFRKQRNCQDHIATLQESLARRKRMDNKETFLTFFDLRKAYDTVWQEALWYKMAKLGIKGKTLKFIMCAYAQSSSSIRTKYGFTDSFQVTRGVRQGCPASPTLFNIYIDDILDDIPEEMEVEVTLNQEEYMTKTGLMFADDLVTLTNSEEHTKLMCEHVNNWCKKWRMSVNASKCLAIKAGKRGKYTPENNPDSIILNDTEEIEYGESYKYLGVHFQQNLTFDKHAHYLLKKLTNKIKFFTKFFKNRLIPPYYQRILLKERILSCVTYAIETWGRNQSVKNLLQSEINKATRKAFGLHKKASVTAIHAELDIPSMETLFKQQQVAFALNWRNHDWLGANELYHDPIENPSNPRTFFCPVSAAKETMEYLLEEDEQELKDEEKKIFLRNLRTKLLKEELDEKADCKNPTKGCILYRNILDYAQELKEVEEEKRREENENNGVEEKEEDIKPKQDYQVPKYFHHIQTINKKSFFIDSKVINDTLKLRTGTYPFMNIFKNFHKDKNLTSNCILCTQNKRENLHHIIYECPAYDNLRTKLNLPAIEMEDASIQLLQDDSLTNFSNTHPNMLKIHDFLSLRWDKLTN